jgi:predicted ATPase
MIEAVRFQNFKLLKQTTLLLQRFTLIVGPNGSGKTTAFQALRALADPDSCGFRTVATAGLGSNGEVRVTIQWCENSTSTSVSAAWLADASPTTRQYRLTMGSLTSEEMASLFTRIREQLESTRVYSLDARAIAEPTPLEASFQLHSDGGNLAAVLDTVANHNPEIFEALNREMSRWLPEFDRILFDTTKRGSRGVLLQTRLGHHKIQAKDLSQGVLLALALLTISYLPSPPAIVCIEEPDRGIHPRLLRDVRDALYRLSHPSEFEPVRTPVQVIATTHSPYFLDLYRDHPEEVVIAQKLEDEVKFDRLADRSDLDEILEDSRLGDIWYTGILGGVPLHT